jgi:histidinol-phosphate aminotransferase
MVTAKLLDISNKPDALRKYPNPMGDPLRTTIAKTFGFDPDEVTITNGSDEALAMICKIFLNPGDSAVIADPTYSLYPTLISSMGATCIKRGRPDSFSIDLELLEDSDASLVFLPNPNAPTGEFIEPDVLEKVIQKSSKLWIIDEAYNDFVNHNHKSFIERLENNSNVIVTRTFSKSHSLAGLRVGYTLSKNTYINRGLKAGKDSYNEDALALQLADAAFRDQPYYDSIAKQIITSRINLKGQLEKLNFSVLPSEGNFLFVRHQSVQAVKILNSLKANKILIRHFPDKALEEYLRITIGTELENEELFRTLNRILVDLK